MKTSPVGRDCLKTTEEELLRRNWADGGTLAMWRKEAVQKIEEAVAQVQREPAPDPFQETWRAIFSEHLSEGGEE